MQWLVDGALLMCFFGYVALGYTRDPETCLASDLSDHRIVLVQK